MTATELLELLKRYPKACGVLGITLHCVGSDEPHCARCQSDDFQISVGTSSQALKSRRFHSWLLGHAMTECDGRRLRVSQDEDCPEMFVRPTGQFSFETYTTRLEACLAALEQA